MNTHSASPTPSTSTRKRTHLKPSQVATLQEAFNTNPLPDSSVRSQLAQELAVTERTIQIWFQNRRAKARKIDVIPTNTSSVPSSGSSSIRPNTTGGAWLEQQQHLQRHSTPPRYQATFRTMMTPERFEELKDGQQQIRKRPRSCSKPEPKSSLLLESFNNSRAMSEGVHQKEVLFPSNTPTGSSNLGGHQHQLQQQQQQQQQVNTPMVPLPVSVLRIGSWTRFAHASAHTNQKDWDLVCYSNPMDREFIWRVQAEGHHFRIQVMFDSISQIRLCQQIQVETGEIVGQLDIETSLPLIIFSMWRFGQDHQWVRCGDFTEGKQASVDSLHILQGSHEAFKQALLDLIALAPELASKITVLPVISPDQIITSPPSLDLCRDFTMSPSATPEPSTLIAAANAAAAAAAAAAASAATTNSLTTASTTNMIHHPTNQQMIYHGNVPYGMINPQHLSKVTNNMSHLMLQAPFFYPNTTNGSVPAANQHNNNLPHGHSTTPSNEELYQMQQYMMQQQQQQQMMYVHSASATPNPTLM